MPKIYLAGPIDNCTDNQKTNWRNFVQDQWPAHLYYCPVMLVHNKLVSGKIKDTEVALNKEKQFIRDCDFLLAYPWKASVGTSMEIIFAHEIAKKPVIVVNPFPTVELSFWIKHHTACIANSFSAAMNYIDKKTGMSYIKHDSNNIIVFKKK